MITLYIIIVDICALLAAGLIAYIWRRRTEEALRTAEADLRAAKELAEAATQAKSEFLAHMSHDMRTPLSSALGIAALLEQTSLDAEQRKMVQIILTSGNALLDLLNNFLDSSKIEAGKLVLKQHPFELRACVEETIDLVTGRVADRSLDLAYILDPHAPAIVVGDQLRLRQILVNLLSNAVKFTDTGGIFVSMAARTLDQDRYELHFSVADTGSGISPAEIETVFDSFQQLDSSPVAQSLGTGLGLTIGKRLSEVMGGRMWVESALGAGSTFHFTIVVSAAPDLISDGLAARPQLAAKHLLIVDRHPQSRQAICMYAQSIGMRVSAASSALEALAWADCGAQFDVAVADMRDANGEQISLAIQLRELSHRPALPVILLAPLGMQDNRTRAGEYDLLLHKPLKLSQLEAALFQIFADQTQPEAAAIAQHQPTVPDTMSALPRILIAEDDRANQQLALRVLQIMGYPHAAVSTGAQTLAMLEREYYDIVLLDIHMPDLDGLAATRLIRRHYRAERQPYLIAITASASPDIRAECLSAGMNDYLSKPLQIPQLQAAITRYQASISASTAPEQYLHDRTVGTPVQEYESAPSTSAPLDTETFARVRALFGPGQDVELRTLIESYRTDSAALITKMHVANATEDHSLLEQAVHQLKSSSAIVAALPLAELCKEFEAALHTNGTYDWQVWIERTEAEFTRVRAALNKEL
jgi:signal transduction histidine kinase/CheY-like chemotaxis protein/HPt (histidine-containing phosphotransfer) domain-containing protein